MLFIGDLYRYLQAGKDPHGVYGFPPFQVSLLRR